MGSSVIILVVGIATFFNLVILLWKFQHDRVMDGILDLGALVLIGIVFGGSITALSIGMVASALFSIYLLISPPNLEFAQ